MARRCQAQEVRARASGFLPQVQITRVAWRCQAQGVEARASSPFLLKSYESFGKVRSQGAEAREFTSLQSRWHGLLNCIKPEGFGYVHQVSPPIEIKWEAERCQAQGGEVRASNPFLLKSHEFLGRVRPASPPIEIK